MEFNAGRLAGNPRHGRLGWGRGLLIGGAVRHEDSAHRLVGLLAVDPITGKTKQLGNLGSNARPAFRLSTMSAASGGAARLSASHINTASTASSHGTPRRSGSQGDDRDSRLGQARLARRFGRIPAVARFHRAHPTEHLRLSSRGSPEWTCDKGLLDTHPASDGQHILTLESTEPLPSDGTVIYGEAHLCIRKASNGNVIWSTPPFPTKARCPTPRTICSSSGSRWWATNAWSRE